MSPSWGDLVARARGLERRWGLGVRLADLERAGSLEAIRAVLAAAGYAVGTPVTAAGVEGAVAAVASDWRRILGRWAGARRRRLLAVLFEEETVRTLERMARGALEGAPARDRMAAVVATSPGERRLLQRLAEAASLGEIAAALREAEHPYAEAVAGEAGALRPDPWRLSLSLHRRYLWRAFRGAARADRPAREHVALVVDHRNLWTALLEGREPGGCHEAEELFVPGGRRLDLAAFRRALEAPGPESRPVLAERFAGSGLAAALEEGRPLSVLEDAAGEDRLVALRRRFRLDPVSSAGVLLAVLELSREHRRIREIAWRLELVRPEARAA